MIRRSFACIAVLFAASARSFGDVSQLIEYHWNTFSNVSRFQEFYSITKLPAAVRSDIVRYRSEVTAGELGKRRDDTIAPADSFRLVWAATDGTNYVVHWESDSSPVPVECYSITAAIRESGGTNLIISSGPCDFSLDDYNHFIEYEKSVASIEVFSAVDP